MAKFKAIIDLYGSQTDHPSATSQCVELAQRRLVRLDEQNEKRGHENLDVLREQLHRADQLRPDDPDRAKAIYAAVVELYQNKPWAAKAVERAREGLKSVNTAIRPNGLKKQSEIKKDAKARPTD